MSFIIACENGNRKIAELLLANKEADVKYTDETRQDRSSLCR